MAILIKLLNRIWLFFLHVHPETTLDAWMKSKCFFSSAFPYLWRGLRQRKPLDFHIAFCIFALGGFLNAVFFIAVTIKPKWMIIVPCLYLLYLDPAKILDLVFVFFNLSHLSSFIFKNLIQGLRNTRLWTVSLRIFKIILVLELIISTDMMGFLKLASWMFYSSGFLRNRERTSSKH